MQWNAYVVRWWYAIIIPFKIEFSTRMNLNHLKINFFIIDEFYDSIRTQQKI